NVNNRLGSKSDPSGIIIGAHRKSLHSSPSVSRGRNRARRESKAKTLLLSRSCAPTGACSTCYDRKGTSGGAVVDARPKRYGFRAPSQPKVAGCGRGAVAHMKPSTPGGR